MKKLYFLMVAILATTFSFGQASDLYFSMYGEGSSSNKFLEIYNGTGANVDLSGYSVEEYSNGAATASNTLTFDSGTILNSGDVYVIYNSSADDAITSNGDVASAVTYFNGDDAIALLKNGTAIDVIGVVGTDPGSSWTVGSSGSTANHTLTRKSTICDPTTDWAASAGTDDASSQWIVGASNSGWDTIGSFSGCSSSPTLTITSPSSGATEGSSDVDVVFIAENFDIGAADGTHDGHVKYTVDSEASVMTYSADPIALTGLVAGSHTVTLELVDDNDASLSTAVTSSVTFEIASYTAVANLTALRAGTEGENYEITGPVVVTYTRDNTHRNQKYIEDYSGADRNASGAGILIDDNEGIITTTYNIGDVITGLKGTLGSYNGIMQLVPLTDAGTVTDTGKMVTPEEVTCATLATNWEDYESELVKIVGATFADGDGAATFSQYTNYTINDGADLTFRTNFSEANYIGEVIPNVATDLVVLVGEYYNSGTDTHTPQVYARDINDISVLGVTSQPIVGFNLFPNPVNNGILSITTQDNLEKNIQIFNVLGKQVLATTTSSATLNVSSLNSGIYIIRVEEAGRLATRKLVIE